MLESSSTALHSPQMCWFGPGPPLSSHRQGYNYTHQCHILVLGAWPHRQRHRTKLSTCSYRAKNVLFSSILPLLDIST